MNRRGLTGPGRPLGVRGFLRKLRKANWAPAISFFDVTAGGKIRAVEHAQGRPCCPITGIHFAETGEYRLPTETSAPARRLRIPSAFESLIILAADEPVSRRSRHPAAVLRRQMLQVLGLQEVAQ